MGLFTEAINEIRASLPFPGGKGRTFLGWGGQYIGGATQAFRLPGERDVRSSVGDGGGTALVSAAVNWMARELVPARPVLVQYAASDPQQEGVPSTLRRHAALDLLRQPNPYYDGTTMRMGCALSYLVDGNVYRWKIRSAMRRVVAEWWLPHWCIEPIGRANFIDFYKYTVGGQSVEIDPADIQHLRFGLDPENPRRGLSPIRGVLREVYTDEEYARFSASLAHNMGFPGAVIIPGTGVAANKEAREEMIKTFDDKFTGDGRGRTVALSANAEVKFLQWSPKDLDLSSLRDVPEERVSSVLGIPAAVLGFGTGLQQVKVGATMRELRSMGWEGALIPFLMQLAENDTHQLLPEFLYGPELARTEVKFDTSEVAALSDMQLKRAEIEATLVRSGIKKVDEARMKLGLPAVGGQDGDFQASPGVGSGATRPVSLTPLPSENAEEDEDEEDAQTAGDLLSDRERQVALAAARGLPNKQIAEDLGLSARTVERYLASARAKLGFDSRSEFAVWAERAERAAAHEKRTGDAMQAIPAVLDRNTAALLDLARAVTQRTPDVFHLPKIEIAAPPAPPAPPPANVNVTIQKGAVQHETHIDKGAIQSTTHTPVTIEKGAVQSDTHIDNGGDVELVRDAQGRVTRTRSV